MKRALLIAATVLALTPAAASAQAVVLGAAAPANASCPTNCLVEARVTGFQTSIGKTNNPFVAPADGQIVSWSIKLGKPKKADVKAFNKEFGPPQARLSILKPVAGTSNPTRYKLLRQSPAQPLGKILGRISTFNLATPLAVKADQVVALTIPTWAPAFAVGQSSSTRGWRAAGRRRSGEAAPTTRAAPTSTPARRRSRRASSSPTAAPTTAPACSTRRRSYARRALGRS